MKGNSYKAWSPKPRRMPGAPVQNPPVTPRRPPPPTATPYPSAEIIELMAQRLYSVFRGDGDGAQYVEFGDSHGETDLGFVVIDGSFDLRAIAKAMLEGPR